MRESTRSHFGQALSSWETSELARGHSAAVAMNAQTPLPAPPSAVMNLVKQRGWSRIQTTMVCCALVAIFIVVSSLVFLSRDHIRQLFVDTIYPPSTQNDPVGDEEAAVADDVVQPSIPRPRIR